MDNARIGTRYTKIKGYYENTTLHARVNKETTVKNIKIKSGVRQRDPMSPKLFTAAHLFLKRNNLSLKRFQRIIRNDKGIP